MSQANALNQLTFYGRHAWILIVLAAACQSDTQNPPAVSKTNAEEVEVEGEFFGDSLVEESTELGQDFRVVLCAGATPAEQANLEHPRLIRGQLVAPHGRIAAWSPLDLIVSTAYAVPIGGEQTVGNTEIRMTTLDESGQTLKVVIKTTSDALGRYCFKLPDDIEFGPRLALEASASEHTLRALALSRAHGNISVVSDVVLRLAVQEGPLTPKRRNHLINLHTLADSAVDLIEPVELGDDDMLDSARAKVRSALLADPRFGAALKAH